MERRKTHGHQIVECDSAELRLECAVHHPKVGRLFNNRVGADRCNPGIQVVDGVAPARGNGNQNLEIAELNRAGLKTTPSTGSCARLVLGPDRADAVDHYDPGALDVRDLHREVRRHDIFHHTADRTGRVVAGCDRVRYDDESDGAWRVVGSIKGRDAQLTEKRIVNFDRGDGLEVWADLGDL